MPAAALHRRRQRCFLRGLSPIAAAALAALLLLSVLAFLACPPVDTPSLPRRPAHIAFGDPIGSEDEFVIPSGGRSSGSELWGSNRAKYYFGCSNSSKKFQNASVVTRQNRHLMIATSGGLNQQRTGITDAVVVARILNATLVVPKLDQKSFWKDSSNFSDIFDVDWFISTLSRDVKIVKGLPRKGGKAVTSAYTMRVPRKCNPRCYQNRVLPVLLKKHAVQLTKFDYRLSNKLVADLQKLRCRVNYHALKFTKPIQEMGDKLIERMKRKGKHFIALHLRFEPDMLAFSGCYYGGGEKERTELAAIRRRWRTLHTKNPEKERRHGKCPLTPEEVGLMLRALGFGSDVHIYVASGEVYGGEATLAPLKALFPNIHSKESLVSKEELRPFSRFSSRMAAIDFIVCDGSDVFVTNNNGNMARILAGRRKFFGHKRTIRPNAKKLYSVFLNRTSMNWDTFSLKVRTRQRGFMGEPKEVRPGRGEFHENPSTCICETPEAKTMRSLGFKTTPKEGIAVETALDSSSRWNEQLDGRSNDEEPEWPDTDDVGDESSEGGSSNITGSDEDLLTRSEETELDDILSD